MTATGIRMAALAASLVFAGATTAVVAGGSAPAPTSVPLEHPFAGTTTTTDPAAANNVAPGVSLFAP